MASAVVLLHSLPDGSSHFDLLIERSGAGEASARPVEPSAWSPPTQRRIADPDERRLLAYRLDCEPHAAGAGAAFDATRLEDHRALYLAYEGPIGDDRGHVKRVAVGRVARLTASSARIEAVIAWSSREPRRYIAERTAGARWRVSVAG